MSQNNTENIEWSSLSYEEKNRQLFLRQKKTLDMFLERGAISQAQRMLAIMENTDYCASLQSVV